MVFILKALAEREPRGCTPHARSCSVVAAAPVGQRAPVTVLSEVRVVPRPIEEVFAYVADFSTTAEYDPGVVRAERLDPVAEGARFRVFARFMGRTSPMDYHLERYVPCEQLVFHGQSTGARARDDIRFEVTEDGTRILWTLELELLGPGRWLEPLLRRPLIRLGQRALDGLSERLHRATPLTPR